MSKVSLDDLLELKRAELPESAFWDRFDQELKKKQLKAFVSGEKSKLDNNQPKSLFRFIRIASGVAIPACFALIAVLLWNKHQVDLQPHSTASPQPGLEPITEQIAIAATPQAQELRLENINVVPDFIMDALPSNPKSSIPGERTFSRDLTPVVYRFSDSAIIADVATPMSDGPGFRISSGTSFVY